MYQPYPGSDTQLPEPQRPPAPPSVRNAVKVMYVTAIVLLWRRSSTAYFKGTPA